MNSKQVHTKKSNNIKYDRLTTYIMAEGKEASGMLFTVAIKAQVQQGTDSRISPLSLYKNTIMFSQIFAAQDLRHNHIAFLAGRQQKHCSSYVHNQERSQLERTPNKYQVLCIKLTTKIAASIAFT
jgi:hypothetical protein